MRKRQSKKSALLTSIISMILCIAMLVGTTMAWFTDTASVSSNKIQAGTLDVEFQYLNGDTWENAEGKILQFKKAVVNEGESEAILWEPGCTYELPQIKVINKGNLALQYSLVISGFEGDVELLEVIDFTIDNSAEEGVVLPGKESDPITIKGHMDENAGNGYQGKELSGISITVYATQTPYEYDSYGNQYDANAEDKVFDIIIPDEDMNPEDEFDVYEVHEAYPLNGNGGFAIVAEFDGAPGQIYVARTTSYTPVGKDRADGEGATPWAPMAMARVEDPDGNLVAWYDFSDLESDGENPESDAVIIDIPEGKAGIWTIRMMNGQPDDVFEIGIKDPEHWGVRGEMVLEKNLSSSYYLYAQSTATYLYVASESAKEFSLYKGDVEVAKSASTPRTPTEYLDYSLNLQNPTPDSVYELRLSEDFDGTLVVQGVSGLLCTTKEDAEALQGYWVEEDGVLYGGALQARARQEIVKLASNSDLTVEFVKEDTLPELENAIAEAQLFGAYAPISSLSLVLERQVIDPNHPACGLILIDAAWDYTNHKPTDIYTNGFLANIQSGAGSMPSGVSLGDGTTTLAALAHADLQLNYLYQNEAIIKRCVLSLLNYISMISGDGMLHQGNLTSSVYPHSDVMFNVAEMAEAYNAIYPYLDCVDESTREVLKEGFMLIADKIGDYTGQGPTNQAAHGMQTRLLVYNVTGVDRYLDAFERQYNAIIDNVWPSIGVSDAGYFVETKGVDAQYGYMNQYHYYRMYNIYKELDTADSDFLKKMRDMVEETLEFEALLVGSSNPTSYSYSIGAVNHFTSRTADQWILNAYPVFQMVQNEFPMAKKRVEMDDARSFKAGLNTVYPHRVTTVDTAKTHINTFYGLYDNYYYSRNSKSRTGDGSYLLSTYEELQKTSSVEACELPCEREDGFLRENQDGIVALKHEGLYMVSFYRPFIEGATYSTKGARGGGGPTLIWSEGTGVSVVGQKYANNDNPLTNKDQVRPSVIYGTDSNGNFFVSGKETASLTWIEEGKSFVISGTTEGKTISWKYELTETGIDITASLTGDSGVYWINLPVGLDRSGTYQPEHIFENNTLTVKYDEDNDNVDVRMLEYKCEGDEVVAETINNGGIRYLRVKLNPQTASAKISVTLK